MKVKCRFCDKKDTERDEMEVEEHLTAGGNKSRKYFHKLCYPKYLAEKEFKEKEQDELDKLVEVMLEVHNLKTLPHQFYPFIQDLRNGTVLFGKKKKKYKQGYPYSLIAKTYIACRESIEYWQKNKNFKDTMQELKYCWAIINDKINVVRKLEEKKAHHKAIAKAKEESEPIETKVEKPNVEFKKQKREDDISSFL